MLIKYLLPFLFEQLDTNHQDFSALSWHGREIKPTQTPFISLYPPAATQIPSFPAKVVVFIKNHSAVHQRAHGTRIIVGALCHSRGILR